AASRLRSASPRAHRSAAIVARLLRSIPSASASSAWLGCPSASSCSSTRNCCALTPSGRSARRTRAVTSRPRPLSNVGIVAVSTIVVSYHCGTSPQYSREQTVTQDFEFGLDTFLPVTVDAAGRPIRGDQVIRNAVEEAVLAEAVGLDSFNIGEHYRTEFMDSA